MKCVENPRAVSHGAAQSAPPRRRTNPGKIARRAGTTPAIDQVNKYFQICCMPVVTSTYWPMVHGQSAEQVREDAEGMQIMRGLGTNMAWMLQATASVPAPEVERKIMTNFIR